MLILMGIWEDHRALLNPPPLEVQIGGRRRAGGVLCYVSSAIIGQELQQVLGNQLCQSCGANHVSLVIRLIHVSADEKKKVPTACPLPINQFFAIVMNAE